MFSRSLYVALVGLYFSAFAAQAVPQFGTTGFGNGRGRFGKGKGTQTQGLATATCDVSSSNHDPTFG